MTATNHALTGAVVALAVKQPILAIPIALISHFVVDIVPHYDMSARKPRSFRIIVALDSVFAICLILSLPFLLNESVSAWKTFVCMLAAISPDLIWVWRYYKYKSLNRVITEPMSPFSKIHKNIQWSETPKGGYIELLWLAAAALLILVLK